jgi:DNA uptake protein ComE-like DNA-binding protein
MKLNDIIKDYFSFNRNEQRGLFVLLTILFLLVIANEVIPLVIRPRSFDMKGFEKEVVEFEEEVRMADSLDDLAQKSKYKKFRSPGGFPRDSTGAYKPFPDEVFVIELNLADTFLLQKLRGIGPSFARRIVKYRERLGGYINKSQLLEIWGMDTVRYNAIKEHLIVNPDSVHKVNLNTVTFKKLLSHPYFPFEITKAIMIYRKDHKKFLSVNELKSIKISDSACQKIWPYVEVRK